MQKPKFKNFHIIQLVGSLNCDIINLMKKKVLKLFLIVVVLILFVIAVITSIFLIWGRGVPNTEVWSEQDEFSLDYTIQMQKEPDKDFVILNLADIQVGDYKSTKTLKSTITTLINRNRPDLITLSGDQFTSIAFFTIKDILNFINDFGIPFAPVFGNHDGNGGIYNKNGLADLCLTYEHCLFKKGPNNLGDFSHPSIGNYIITIMESDKVVKALYMLDSNARRKGMKYDYIHYEQIEWYEWAVKGLERVTGNNVESLAFFHIPLQETKDAYFFWKESGFDTSIGFGHMREAKENKRFVWYSDVNTGMFDKIKELDSTKYVFNGHDHKNNFSVQYLGVRLTYCTKTGHFSYHDKDLNGGTVITLSASSHAVEIHHDYVKP